MVVVVVVAVGWRGRHAHHPVRERFTILAGVVRNIFGSHRRLLLLLGRRRSLRNWAGRHFQDGRRVGLRRGRSCWIRPSDSVALVDVARRRVVAVLPDNRMR
jgi:hypothetical protein